VGAPAAAVVQLRGNSTRPAPVGFTINDKVVVNGETFTESSGIADNLGCNEIGGDGAADFEVCGCGVTIEVFLRTECGAYKQYDQTIGDCDCKKYGNACNKVTLTSGYTDKFNWKAASIKISPCEAE